jgi:hypothetical protein
LNKILYVLAGPACVILTPIFGSNNEKIFIMKMPTPSGLCEVYKQGDPMMGAAGARCVGDDLL